MMACRPNSWKAMFWAECRAAVAIGTEVKTRSGYETAHSSACMPPIDPPITQNSWSMPRWSSTMAWARTMSAIVMTGKSRPQRLPVAGLISFGPVDPMQPPSTLTQTTK